MITYNPAFDLYHAIYRMAHIVQRLGEGEQMEIDKARIWDFYLLFPDKVYNIYLKRSEKYLRDARKKYIHQASNPYDYQGDNRKLFEWLRPVQVSALGCLVACGILEKDDYLTGMLRVTDASALEDYLGKIDGLSAKENNTLSFMSILSKEMPLTGAEGLKQRTELLEFKYDVQ